MKKIKRRIKKLIYLILGILRYPFFDTEYGIKRGYIHRRKYAHFSDIGAKDEAQNEVYETAERFARKNNYQSIIDIGCGAGYKLIKFFSKDYDITGIDIQTTYEYLVKTYPQYKWINGETINFSQVKGEIVICADVIEHVVDPDALIEQIKQIRNVKLIFFSTPDRLLVRGCLDFGPPENWSHMREWDGKEFVKYISSKFAIISHQVSNYEQGTQMIICKPF